MAYATQAQIQLAAGGDPGFTSLFDWDGNGVADPNVIAEAQARADGWIDGFLRERYATPIAVPSDTLIRISADECVYWARSARPGVGVDERDIEKHKERQAYLEAIRDGKIRLDEPNPTKSTAVVAAVVENCSPISREGLKGSIW